MAHNQYDVIIMGGGPAGCALAAMLARASDCPARVALIQADQSTRYGLAPGQDPRVLAVNHGSRVLLESIGAWPAQSASIHTIHVSQRNRLGRSLIKHEDFGVSQLGCVVGYSDLHAGLAEAAKLSGVTILHGKATALAQQDSHRAIVTLANEMLEAQVLVQADGLTDSQAIRDYQQVAIIAYARASAPRAGWAFERFTQEGPLAVLPHPSSDALQSIVWCCSPKRAQALHALPLADFSAALTHAFGLRLGDLHVEAPTTLFPLTLTMKARLVEKRCVAIGNAAQTMHPVAGQGLNLALRDAATLAQSLSPWLSHHTDSPEQGLKDFIDRRNPDRQLTVQLTDLMSRFFTTGIPLIEHAAGAGLLAIDLLPLVRRPLARHLLQGLRL